MAGIYNEEKMKQKPVYPTRETAQYSDWALFNMGKELEKVVDELGPGAGEVIGTAPIVVTKSEGTTGISLDFGDGLKKDENDKLIVDVEDSHTLEFNTITGELHANIFGMLKDGDDINYNSYGPSLPRAVKPVITGKITDGNELLSTTSEHLVSAKAVKDALATKQNKMTAPTTGGLIISGTSENLIGINFKSSGGITYDENGAVMVDETVVQHKLTAGAGLEIDNNVVKTKYSGGVARMGTVSFGTTIFTAGQTKVITQDLNLPDNRMNVPSNAPWWCVAFGGQTQGLIARSCLFVKNGNTITAQAEVHNAGGADKQATLTIGYMGWIE